jgi:hypothetical protein
MHTTIRVPCYKKNIDESKKTLLHGKYIYIYIKIIGKRRVKEARKISGGATINKRQRRGFAIK